MKERSAFEVDRERLRHGFFAALDETMLSGLGDLSAGELSRRHECIGEGSRFVAWRLRGGRSSAVGGALPRLDLVYKRLVSGPVAKDGPARRIWLERLKKANRGGQTLPLWPPIEVVSSTGQIALVMPFGEQPFAQAAPRWQPLPARLRELDAALAGMDLALGDSPQGRCWQGIPFIIDVSDINPALEQPGDSLIFHNR